jgi:hypothetical protein
VAGPGKGQKLATTMKIDLSKKDQILTYMGDRFSAEHFLLLVVTGACGGSQTIAVPVKMIESVPTNFDASALMAAPEGTNAINLGHFNLTNVKSI